MGTRLVVVYWDEGGPFEGHLPQRLDSLYLPAHPSRGDRVTMGEGGRTGIVQRIEWEPYRNPGELVCNVYLGGWYRKGE